MGWLQRLTNVLPGKSGFNHNSTAEDVAREWDGNGKTIIVTGANAGLGKETSRVLATHGAEVVMACRSKERCERAAAEIRSQYPTAKLVPMELDLSSIASVRSFATNFKKTRKPLHVLVNNAGIMACPFAKTADGVEIQFATNVLGPFLLTELLTPNLIETGVATPGGSRVVNVSSSAHNFSYGADCFTPEKLLSNKGYQDWTAYGQSKLGNILHAREYNRRMREAGNKVAAFSLHPGVIVTDLQIHQPVVKFLLNIIKPLFLKSVEEGASTSVYLATAPIEKLEGGRYYKNNNVARANKYGEDATGDLAAKLWGVLTKLANKQPIEA